MKTRVDEISPEVFRISTLIPEIDLEFNQFLVRDEEPLLYHTGLRALFPPVREAVARLIDPAQLRWVGFSHFEQDECGTLNEWLALAPNAQPVCGLVGAVVNVNDFTSRQIAFLQHDQAFSTGRFRFRFLSTPHVPHAWDASLLFEETEATLFCSDLFTHTGARPALSADVVELAHQELLAEKAGPLGASMAYNGATDRILRSLAELRPRTLAVMHGSSFAGDGAAALEGLRASLREVLREEL